jgi:hypothetical protein
MDKRIIYCKIYFKESKTDRLLKPKKILSLSTDVEIAAMSDLTSTNEKNMSWIDDLDTDDNHFPSDNFF